eukprot:scaffold11188_cov85-Skeletonema_dohrnii-CCMP3373.AAC.3
MGPLNTGYAAAKDARTRFKMGESRKHDAKVKLCSSEGCMNKAQNGRVCYRHGANRKGCTNFVVNAGASVRKTWSKGQTMQHSEGCVNKAIQQGGACVRHGAKVKRCSSEGCTNHQSKQGGVCMRHGAQRANKYA